jgi:hypothetical protein
MDRFHLRYPAAIAALFVTVGTASCYPFEDLLKGVPNRANAVFLVNVRAIQRSALGVNRNWAEKQRRNYLGGLTNLPPTVNRLVVGEQLDTTALHPSWRIALVDLSEPITPAELLRHESGTQDTIGGLPVVVSPRGRVFLFLSDKLIAECETVNRQEISRWLNAYKGRRQSNLSKYLTDAAEGMRPGAQVTLAFDLSDVFDLEGVRKRLQESETLKGKRIDINELAKTIASIRGVKLIIEVDKDIDGEIRLDFAESAEPLRTIGKDLLLHAMRSMGAALDDLDSWQGSVEEKAFVLRGKLTERGARMLLSPASSRTSGTPYAGAAAKLETEPPNPKAIPSQMYFRSVTSLLDELNNEKKPRNISQRGYWYQQYATKIDNLPILNVDPDLLEFGAAISSTLRGMANLGQVAKDTNAMIQANQIDNLAVNVGYNTYSGGRAAATPWGAAGYGWNWTAPVTAEVSNYRSVSNLCHRTAATEKAYREATWKNINEYIQTTRRKMVAKFNVEF